MTVKQAAQQARTAYKAHASELFDFLLFQVIVRLIPLTPCLFLLTPNLKMLSLLSVPLFLLLVPFVREKTAAALQSALEGGPLFSREYLGTEERRKRSEERLPAASVGGTVHRGHHLGIPRAFRKVRSRQDGCFLGDVGPVQSRRRGCG